MNAEPIRAALSAARTLAAFALFITVLMAVTHQLTAPAIEAAQDRARLERIHALLDADSFDNDLLNDAIALPPLAALGLDEPSQALRARKNGAPVAVLIEARAPDGYGGAIDLLLAIAPDARLLGVRVTGHHETPGLGDYIDTEKDRRTPKWITQFDGVGLQDVPASDWQPRKDGGHFDARTGATISARAVMRATARALQWAGEHRGELFAAPAAGD